MTADVKTSRRALVIDGLLAAALLAVCLLTAPLLNAWVDRQRTVDLIGYALLVLACLPLAVRRLYPLSVLTVSTIAVSAYLVLGYPYGPVFLPLVVAVYSVGRGGPTLRAVLASVGAFLALLVHLFVGASAAGVLGAMPAAAWIAVPLTVGIARRLVTESQARERAETERRKLDDERLRLATEVHDIVGHGLAAIQMHADIALHIADAKPDQARIALEAISSASAAALSELRTTLGSIGPETADSDSRAPTPGLDRIDELCRRVREAGAAVELTVIGARRPVPPEIDVAAYRIVQESLTNAVKHATARRAAVVIDYAAQSIALTVTSPHDGTPIEEGFGIRGMRRRVEQLGGEFAVEHNAGIHVRAVLPAATTCSAVSTPRAHSSEAGRFRPESRGCSDDSGPLRCDSGPAASEGFWRG